MAKWGMIVGVNERSKCARTHDEVATKLGIILLSFFFFLLPCISGQTAGILQEGVCLRFLIFACLSKKQKK